VLAALPWHYDSGGGAAYRARAETAARIFLPYVVKGAGGWTSSLTLRNPLAQPVALTVTFIGPNGQTVTSVGASLNPFGATTLPLRLLTEVPLGFQGAAVVEGASGLSAVVHQDRAGSSRHTYVGVGGGGPRLYAPLVEKGGRRGSTVLHLQNLGDTRETVQVSYYSPAGALLAQDSLALTPRMATPLRLAETASLPDGFVGAAFVESAGGAPLGGVAAQLGSGGEATSYTLPSEGGTTLAAPLVFKNSRGWATGIQVLNTGSAPAQVTASEGRPGAAPGPAAPPSAGAAGPAPAAPPTPATGPQGAGMPALAGATPPASGQGPAGAQAPATATPGPAFSAQAVAGPGSAAPSGGAGAQAIEPAAQDSATIPPRGSVTFYQPANAALPDDYVGSATITTSGGPLVAIVNQARAAGNLLMSYGAAPAGAPVVDVPLLTKDHGGWSAGLRVQNLATEPAEIAITYYDQAGRAVHAAQDHLPAAGSATYPLASLPALPWGFLGAATVTSNGRPIAVVVNLLKPSP
jgi:hypothetical protein